MARIPKIKDANAEESQNVNETTDVTVNKDEVATKLHDLVGGEENPGTADLMGALQAGASISPEDEARAKAEQTDQFNSGAIDKPAGDATNSKKTVSPEEAKEKLAQRLADSETNTALIAQLGNNNMNPDERAFRMAMSATCKIVAYFCNKGEHNDIVAEKFKNLDPTVKETSYEFRAKQYGPTPIKMVMIMVPTCLVGYLNCTADAYATKECKDAVNMAMNGADLSYTPQYVAWGSMVPWLRAHTNGVVREDANLFSSYYEKENGKFVLRTFANRGKSKCAASDSCLYVKLVKRKVKVTTETGEEKQISKPAIIVVHSYRRRVLTPSNYVAMNRYEEVDLKEHYSEEEATEYIAKYLSKFCKTPESKKGSQLPKVSQLGGSTRTHTIVDGTTIISSWLFPEAGKESYFAQEQNKIAHWYDCEPVTAIKDGVETQVLSKKKLPNTLSVKEERLSQTGAPSGSYTFRLHKLGDTLNPFTKEAYPKIFAAINSKTTNAVMDDVVVDQAMLDRLSINAATLSSEFDKCVKLSSKGKNKDIPMDFDPSLLVGGGDESSILGNVIYAEASEANRIAAAKLYDEKHQPKGEDNK